MEKPNAALNRAEVLDTAKQYVTHDRQREHGGPEETLSLVAALWSEYLGYVIEPHEASAMMALLKIARSRANPRNMDNFIDGCGYLAIAAELVSDD